MIKIKLGKISATALGAVLAMAGGTSHAYDFDPVSVGSFGSSNTFSQLVGTVTLVGPGLFTLSGNVSAATEAGGIPLDQVLITSSGLPSQLVSGASFSYGSMPAATYQIWAAGSVNTGSGFPGLPTMAILQGQVFAASTTAVSYAGDGVSVQVSMVPEPETYAMFLAGLAVVGTAARRRRA